MFDGSAIAAAELRFREDLWRNAPRDAIEEAEVRARWFGPILATIFGELPDVDLMNLVQGAAEPGAVEDGHLADAVEWMRSREVDYQVSVTAGRPGTEAAGCWLAARDYEPGAMVRRYVCAPTDSGVESPGAIEVRELAPLETEGMSHICTEALELSGLATVLLLGLPSRKGWHCYAAFLDDREVACGAMLVAGKVAIIGLDATLASARGNGCQAALLARRLVDAERAGCDVVVAEVCDEHPGHLTTATNLERLGFVEQGGNRIWRRPSGPVDSIV